MAGPHLDALGNPGHLLLVMAHPDDETIGAGGLLAGAGGSVGLHLILLTDGAPRAAFTDWQARADLRRREMAAALAVAGLPEERCEALGLPDQEAVLNLPALVDRLAERLGEMAPDEVLTHAYEGGHPDHDAAALAVRAACDRLERARAPVPRIVEMPFYHGAGGGMRVQEFLPASGSPEIVVELDGTLRAAKDRMLAAHASQAETLRPFGGAAERFRTAPRHDFTRPPHAGALLYETWGLGMTGTRWRHVAAEVARCL